jgi:hypothetical protein
MKKLLKLLLPAVFPVLAAVPAAAGSARAQDTTLFAACRAADVIVRATVLTATDPQPDWHRLQFRSDQVLKGQVAGEFALMEPAGACCGRSLFALQPGTEVLLFLRRTGPVLHPLGGARGVLPWSAEVGAHVQTLLAATDDAAVAGILVGALAAAEPRIADDAAQALATLPGLQLPPGSHPQLQAALQDALQRGTTRSAALVEVSVRIGADELVDTMLPSYLRATTAQAPLLRRGLLRCAPGQVAQRLPLHTDGTDHGALRAAELLVELPDAEARQALARMLQQHPHPRVQLCIAEGLLAAGEQGHELARIVPEPVLQLAERRRQQPRRFRSIQPRQP